MRQSSCSASSRPIVFLPSRRYGSFSVERSNQPSWGATRAHDLPGGGDGALDREDVRAGDRASAIAAGGVPRGTMTAHGSPQRAAYTAAAPPALPAEGMTKPRAPSVRARVIAMPRPRALNDPGRVLALVLAPERAEPEVGGQPRQRRAAACRPRRASPAPRRRRAASARGTGTCRAARWRSASFVTLALHALRGRSGRPASARTSRTRSAVAWRRDGAPQMVHSTWLTKLTPTAELVTARRPGWRGCRCARPRLPSCRRP